MTKKQRKLAHASIAGRWNLTNVGFELDFSSELTPNQ